MNKQKLPPFYIVTVNYYLADYFAKFVSSLSSLNFVTKLIIINHSPEENLEIFSAPFPVQIINQKNGGYAYGLNRGLQEVDREDAIVLLCNPDIVLLSHEEVEKALIYMNVQNNIGLLIPQLAREDLTSYNPCRKFYSIKTLLVSRIGIFRKWFPQAYREHCYMDYEGLEPIEVDWGFGAAMFYRFSANGRCSVFDERFFIYFEDVDLCAQLWSKGFSVVCYPKLLFFHSWQRQSHKRLSFFYHHIASLIKFISKYRMLPRRKDLIKGK